MPRVRLSTTSSDTRDFMSEARTRYGSIPGSIPGNNIGPAVGSKETGHRRRNAARRFRRHSITIA
ncbi:MAG: hypothetical protein ACI9OJ_001490 [Myxococcota bacterium]|jgi:hypothetical protein